MPSNLAMMPSMISSAPAPIDIRRESRIVAGHRILFHVAHAAVELHAGVGHFAHQPPGLELGHRGFARVVLAAIHDAAAVVTHLPQELDFGNQLRQLEVDPLVFDQRLAERLAAAAVFDRHLEDLFRAGRRAQRADQPLVLELLHLVDEALAFFADAVGHRHADVVEHQLGRVAGPVAHLLQLLADRETLACRWAR